MARFNLTRLSLIKFFVLNKKRTRRTLLVINFSIFLTFFAATSAAISLYTENKIAEKEFELIETLSSQNQLHNYRSIFPTLHKSVDSSIMFDRVINRFNLFVSGTNFGDRLINEREIYFYRTHALIGPMYDLFEEETEEIIEEMKEWLPVMYDKEYVNSLTKNGEFYKKYYVFEKKYKSFKKNTKEFEQYEALTKHQLLKENISEEHLTTYAQYKDYYALAFDLNNYFIEILELMETVYLDLVQNNKSLIATLNQEIKDLSKKESQLILFAFLLQLIIFSIIQFFEISSVITDVKKKKEKK